MTYYRRISVRPEEVLKGTGRGASRRAQSSISAPPQHERVNVTSSNSKLACRRSRKSIQFVHLLRDGRPNLFGRMGQPLDCSQGVAVRANEKAHFLDGRLLHISRMDCMCRDAPLDGL